MERDEMGTFDDLKIRLDALEALVGIYSECERELSAFSSQPSASGQNQS